MSVEISNLEVLDAIEFTEGINSSNYSGGCRNDSDLRSCNYLASGNMITFILFEWHVGKDNPMHMCEQCW